MSGAAWKVEVDGYTPVICTAATSAKARWQAYRQFCELISRQSFGDFLARGVRVTKATEFEVEQYRIGALA